MNRWVAMVILALGSACATRRQPSWLATPCEGMPRGAICGAGSSDKVQASLEMGIIDAQLMALGRIEDQIRVRVNRLRPADVEVSLSGIQFTDYVFEPDLRKPLHVHVRAVLPANHVDRVCAEARVLEGANRGSP